MRVRVMLVALVAVSLAAVSALAGEAAKVSVSKSKTAPTLKQRFAKMDVNHNGILSETEFVNFHKDKAKAWSEAAFKKMGVKEMTLAEYTKAHDHWVKEHAAHHPGWKPTMTAKQIYHQMDINHNGKVSEFEYVSYWVNRAADHAQKTFAKLGGTTYKGLTFAQYETGVKSLEKEKAPLHHFTGYQKTK